jgi:putative tryptophan/tyrosine transport system substrate-binding protein
LAGSRRSIEAGDVKLGYRHIAVFFCLGILAAAVQAADIQMIRIVVGDENRFARETAKNLADILKKTEPAVDVDLTADIDTNKGNAGKQLLVVIGESAIRRAESNASVFSPMLVVASQLTPLELREKKLPIISTIQYEQPLPRLLNLSVLIDANKWRSGNSVVGVIVSPILHQYLTMAEGAATDRKQRLRIEVVDKEMAVGRAVGRLVDEASVFIAIPDPMVHTANTVQPILLLTYRAGIPVIGYSAAYLNAGATVALYSTPEQLARQAAETIAAYRAGKPIPAKQVPRYFTVNVNSTVARSLGIEIATTAVLEDSLRSMKE